MCIQKLEMHAFSSNKKLTCALTRKEKKIIIVNSVTRTSAEPQLTVITWLPPPNPPPSLPSAILVIKHTFHIAEHTHTKQNRRACCPM